MRAARIGVTAIGTDQPVNHQLERTCGLIPIDRRDDHHAMGAYPARIERVHPIVDLAERMIGIATAWPMAKWHGRKLRRRRIDERNSTKINANQMLCSA